MHVALPERYHCALRMLKHEHVRWYQWGIFFFVSVASVFVIRQQTQSDCADPSVSLGAAAIVAAILSLLWTCAATGIRCSSDSWHRTLKHYEDSPQDPKGPFHIFEDVRGRQHWMNDLWQTLRFWHKDTFLSVSRTPVWVGIIVTFSFSALAVFSFLPDSSFREDGGNLYRRGSGHDADEKITNIRLKPLYELPSKPSAQDRSEAATSSGEDGPPPYPSLNARLRMAAQGGEQEEAEGEQPAGASEGAITDAASSSSHQPAPETLGLKDYVKERRKFFRIPEFDIDGPDKTAGELQRFYAKLAADVKSVSAFAGDADVQKRVDEILAKHKAEIAPILDRGRAVEVDGKTQHVRRADWEPLIKDTFAEIQELVNDDKFNAADPRFWEKAFAQLSDGYGDIELEIGAERDLTPAERRELADADTATKMKVSEGIQMMRRRQQNLVLASLFTGLGVVLGISVLAGVNTWRSRQAVKDVQRAEALAFQATSQEDAHDGLSMPSLLNLYSKQIEKYQQEARARATWSFVFAIIAMSAGLAFLLVGAWILISAQETIVLAAGGLISALGGAVAGFVTKTFLDVHKLSLMQLNRYFRQPVLNEHILMAQRLADTSNDRITRKKAYERVIESICGRIDDSSTSREGNA